jgi:hypothetical protein
MAEDHERRSERYLRDIERRLKNLPGAAREEIIRELRTHLDDAAVETQRIAADNTVTSIDLVEAQVIERFGSARRLGRSLALAQQGITPQEAMRRLAFNSIRWALAGVALFIAMACVTLLIGGVPAATPDQLTEISGSYAEATLPTTADTDLLLRLSGHAAFFRVNDDRLPEMATAALVNDMHPGERIYLTVYKRFPPAEASTRAVIPVAAIRTDAKSYLSLPVDGGVSAAPSHSAAIIAASVLCAFCCLWPDLRLLHRSRWQIRLPG